MGTQHIIELNGRRYDAQTGKMLPVSEVPAHKAAPAHAQHHSMDGFVKPKAHAPRKIANTHATHHPVAKSSTLMRKAVKKPVNITPLNGRRTNQPPEFVASNPSEAAVAIATSPERINRAERVKRSSLIKRFGSDIQSDPVHHHAPKLAHHISALAVSQPIAEPTDSNQSVLEAAVSHRQPKPKKRSVLHRTAGKMKLKPRTLSISAAVMAFMVLGGFFAYSNVPNLSMRVASMRSQVEGSLPGYKPSGFAIYGPIKYQPGEIIVSYKSNSDMRNFQITQKTSAWDTESLHENYVSTLKTSYQTVQDKGKTVYLYEDSSATWVDGGIWYKIEGNSQLNTDQVLKIASSL